MDCGMSGFPVHHQLTELAQTHVHQVGDVIQPSHPLSSSSPPAFNFSQHQGLFQWVSSLHQVAKVLVLQHQPSNENWGLISFRSDCSHEIKRCLLLGRKGMINLNRILKSRDITLPTKVHLVKVIVFPIVMYGCESWTIKLSTKESMLLNLVFEKTLESPLDCKEI